MERDLLGPFHRTFNSHDHREKESHCPVCHWACSAHPHPDCARSRVTGSLHPPITMPFWPSLERRYDWTHSHHCVNNWSSFPKVLGVVEIVFMQRSPLVQRHLQEWSTSVGSVGIFRSFIKCLLMSWKLFNLLKVFDKDNFFLDMFQFKVLRTTYCFPVGCFELKKRKLNLKT